MVSLVVVIKVSVGSLLMTRLILWMERRRMILGVNIEVVYSYFCYMTDTGLDRRS